jgi:hypothetical protein
MVTRAPSPTDSTRCWVAGTPATFHAQRRSGSNSVTTNGTANPSAVRTVPVACNANAVCGGSSRAPLTVGPHFGHASRSTRTSHAADAGAAINLSTDSMRMEIPAFRGSHTDALRGVAAEASLLFDDVVEIAEPS